MFLGIVILSAEKDSMPVLFPLWSFYIGVFWVRISRGCTLSGFNEYNAVHILRQISHLHITMSSALSFNRSFYCGFMSVITLHFAEIGVELWNSQSPVIFVIALELRAVVRKTKNCKYSEPLLSFRYSSSNP